MRRPRATTVAAAAAIIGIITPNPPLVSSIISASAASGGCMAAPSMAELERQCGRRLGLNEALADTSVASLAGLLRDAATASPADFAFNPDGGAAPLFLVQSYLGSMLGLRRIAELLPPGQPAYVLYVPVEDGTFGYGSASDKLAVSALAEDVLTRVAWVTARRQLDHPRCAHRESARRQPARRRAAAVSVRGRRPRRRSDPHPADYPYGELGVDQRARTLPNGR